MPHENTSSFDRLVESRLMSARRKQAVVREGLRKIEIIRSAAASLDRSTSQKDQATRLMFQLAETKYGEAIAADNTIEAFTAYTEAEAYRNAGILINEKIE